MKQAVANLFDFEEIHLIQGGYWIFTKALLKRDFGKFKAGTTVPEIHIDHSVRLHIVENLDSHMYDNSPEVNFSLIYNLNG